MTAPVQLGVSVLTHNASDHIDALIDGLERQSGVPLSTLVVDNGSTDDTVERCRDRGMAVRRQANLGVGAGHSAGLYALFGDDRIDYVLLLEHDSVPARTCLQNLIETIGHLKEHDLPVGVIGCEVVHPIENAARLEQAETSQMPVVLSPARRITFNGLLVSWEAFAQVGGPRSDFFVGQEDADLYRRLRRAGVPVRTARNAIVAHVGKGRHRRGEGLPPTRDRYSVRNSTYRDMHLDGHSVRGSVRVIGSMVYALRWRSGNARAVYEATRRGFTGELGALPVRDGRS